MSSRTRWRSRRAVAGVAAGVVVASALAWCGLWGSEEAAERPGDVLVGSRSLDRGGSCSAGTADRDREVDGGSVVPSRGVEVTGVRLVDPHNVELVDAAVLPRLEPDDQPVVTAPPPQWRSTYPVAQQWDWSQAVGVDGGELEARSAREVLLHVTVADPDRDSSFADVEVSYTAGGDRYSERLGRYWLAVAEGGSCPADWYEAFD